MTVNPEFVLSLQHLLLALQWIGNLSLFWKLIFSFVAGALGSTAYITALYFHFVSLSKEDRDTVLKPFLRTYSDNVCKKRVGWYAFIGGSIAMVFQFGVPSFVPVQSLILGATWPAVISQFLSGKMTEPIPETIPSKHNNPTVKTFARRNDEIAKLFYNEDT